MKIAFENIYLEQSKSLKIETYEGEDICHKINWHLHPEYEIVFIKNGKGKILINTYHSSYEDGLLIFLGPNIPHMPFGNSDFKDNAEVVIQFKKEFIEERMSLFPEFQSLNSFMKSIDKGIIFSNEIHRKLTKSFLDFKSQNSLEKLLNFIQILHQLSISTNHINLNGKIKKLQIKSQALDRISLVYEYVNNYYHTPIKSEAIANQLGLTPNSFSRLFKLSTNRGFIDFLNEFRIHKAMELLENDHLQIAEIMYKCGYNDPSYFTKQFKRYSSISPSKYRAQLLDKKSKL